MDGAADAAWSEGVVDGVRALEMKCARASNRLRRSSRDRDSFHRSAPLAEHTVRARADPKRREADVVAQNRG